MARRKKWVPERMMAAIEAMRNKEMGSYKASSVFNLLQTTLRSYVKDRKESSGEAVKPKLGRKQILPFEAEKGVVEHCLLMQRKFFFWLDNSRRHVSRLSTCC